MDTDSFLMHIKTEDFYKDIADLIHLISVKKIKDLFQQVKTKKLIDMFKDELGGKIMTEFCALRAKASTFLIVDFRIKAQRNAQ